MFVSLLSVGDVTSRALLSVTLFALTDVVRRCVEEQACDFEVVVRKRREYLVLSLPAKHLLKVMHRHERRAGNLTPASDGP